MEKETITLKGNKELWTKFVNKLRLERKQVWDELEKFIRGYLKK
jgi:hypothetical protein